MATITITDLRPAGSALFLDGESYLEELSDEITKGTHGGISFITTISPASPQIGSAAVATAVGSAALTYNISKTWGR